MRKNELKIKERMKLLKNNFIFSLYITVTFCPSFFHFRYLFLATSNSQYHNFNIYNLQKSNRKTVSLHKLPHNIG